MLLPQTWLWAKVLQMRCGAMFFQGRNCASNSFPSTILCMVSGIWPSPGPKNHQNQRIGPYFCYRKVASRRSETIPQVRAPKFRLRPTPSDKRNRQPGPGQTHRQTNKQTNRRGAGEQPLHGHVAAHPAPTNTQDKEIDIPFRGQTAFPPLIRIRSGPLRCKNP